MQWHRFLDQEDLNTQFALQIINLLQKAIDVRGRAYAVLSGGKTPVGLLQTLAQQSLDWDKIYICLADERCVPQADPARNERMVQEHLLQGNAQKAHLISLWDEQLNATNNLERNETTFTKLPEFDVVILGMGEDGHTASLFPCAEEIAKGLDDQSSVFIVNPKSAPYQRISLTKARLLKSQNLFIHIVGAKKQAILQEAIVMNNPYRMPISAFTENAQNPQVMYAPE